MIHIYHIVGIMNRAGVENMVMNIIRNINNHKFTSHIVVHGDDVGDFGHELASLGIEIIYSPKLNAFSYFEYRKFWKNLFVEIPSQSIIHSHIRSTASIILREARHSNRGHKTIAHSHNISSGKGVRARIKNTLQFNISKYADYRVGCSQVAGQWLFGRTFLTRDTDSIWYNAINFDSFVFKRDNRIKLREELFINDDVILLGNVARLHNQKNHIFMIDLICKLHQDSSNNYKMLFIGSGDLASELKDYAKKNSVSDYIIFLESRSDVSRYYNAMDIFILPSLFEGLGIVLIEAQVNGLQVIASTGVPEEVDLKTEHFRRVPLDIDAWAKEVEILSRINLDHDILVNNSSKYNIDSYIETVEHMYELIICGKPIDKTMQ